MEKGKMMGAKTPLPSSIQCRWDTMGRALTDGTHLAQWSSAWSDRTWPGYGPPLSHAKREIQSVTTRRQLFASPGGTWKNPKQDLHRERPSGFPSRSNGLERHTETQVGSKGAPHVGHADSVTNDEHRSGRTFPTEALRTPSLKSSR